MRFFFPGEKGELSFPFAQKRAFPFVQKRELENSLSPNGPLKGIPIQRDKTTRPKGGWFYDPTSLPFIGIAAVGAATVPGPLVLLLGAGSRNRKKHNNRERSRLFHQKNEGQSYLVFDDITKYEKNGDDSSSGLKEAPNLKFPTVKKMKDTVLKGKLSEEQKAEVARFPKNEKNEVLVCDFDKLYEPSLPAGALIDCVVWKGERYTFTFHVGERFCGSLSLFNDEQYRKAFQAGYADHAVGNHVTVTETKEADGKTVSHYTSEDAESKRVRFQSKIGNTTVYIDKNYFIRSKYSFAETSSVIPNNITLYCTDGEKCYRIYLYELTEDPTDAVLLSLGLKEYREPAL